MYILPLQSLEHNESETLGWNPEICVLRSPPGDSDVQKSENHKFMMLTLRVESWGDFPQIIP